MTPINFNVKNKIINSSLPQGHPYDTNSSNYRCVPNGLKQLVKYLYDYSRKTPRNKKETKPNYNPSNRN